MGEAESINCWLGDGVLFTAVMPGIEGVGGGGVFNRLSFPGLALAGVKVWLCGVSEILFMVVHCRFAALNKGVSIKFLESSLTGIFACSIWVRFQGRQSVISL